MKGDCQYDESKNGLISDVAGNGTSHFGNGLHCAFTGMATKSEESGAPQGTQTCGTDLNGSHLGNGLHCIYR